MAIIAGQPLKETEEKSFAEVVLDDATGQHTLRSISFFEKDGVIIAFSASDVFQTPNYLTLQVADEQHISLSPACLQFTNHSCEPNVFFDTTNMKMIALRDIQPGEEFRFFYPSTEWKMARPFSCNCQAKNCLGTIGGASQLFKALIQQHRLTDFIIKKLSMQ